VTVRTLILAAGVAAMVDFDGTVIYLALPAIGHEFGAPVAQLAVAGTVLTLGSVFGLPIATLADRRGRRLGLAITTAGFATGNFLTALAPSLAWFALARLLAVTFASVAIGIAIVTVTEAAPANRRGMAVAALSLAGGAGSGLTAVVYPLLAPHWRLLYFAGGAGWLLAIAVFRFLPETATWVAARHDPHPLRVLGDARWRGRLAVIAVATALAYVAEQPGGLFGAYFATTRLAMTPLLVSAVLVASAPFSLAGYLVGGWLTDRAGRRRPGVALWFLTGIAAGLTFLGTGAAYWAGNLGWGLVAGSVQPITSTWFAELFPTRARATSQSVAIVAGALGGVAGLLLVTLLQPRVGLGPALVLLAIAPVAGALLLVLLPETRGAPLPE
jgi:MFS family permease